MRHTPTHLILSKFEFPFWFHFLRPYNLPPSEADIRGACGGGGGDGGGGGGCDGEGEVRRPMLV